ncbi:MAG: MarC family protein [Candidatus Omnitrophica bacterium]|nr:MarC family protein [Candidatus Omnitrophota bacterium]
MFQEIFLASIPIFVAVDAVGVLPIFISLTEGMPAKKKFQVIRQSLVVAFSLAFVFILIGKAVFGLLGITVADFMIAGGLILFCIAVIDLLLRGKDRRNHNDDFAAVPLGTPLIVGPAVLTTSLIMRDQHGLSVTLIALFINIGLAGLIFVGSDAIIRMMGKTGTRVVSKIMALFLAAIAVMMVRRGLYLMMGK